MTTKIIIENDETSNGDLHIATLCGFSPPSMVRLLPGETHTAWISTGHVLSVYETWPTSKLKDDE